MKAEEFFKQQGLDKTSISLDFIFEFAEMYHNFMRTKDTAPPKITGLKSSIKRYLAPTSVLHFGKYKGSILLDIIDLDVDYLVWCLDKFEGFFVTQESAKLIEKEVGRKYKVPENRVEKIPF